MLADVLVALPHFLTKREETVRWRAKDSHIGQSQLCVGGRPISMIIAQACFPNRSCQRAAAETP